MVSNSNRIIKVIPDMKALAENVSGADRSKWDILSKELSQKQEMIHRLVMCMEDQGKRSLKLFKHIIMKESEMKNLKKLCLKGYSICKITQSRENAKKMLVMLQEIQKIGDYKEAVKKQETVISQLEKLMETSLKDAQQARQAQLEVEQIKSENLNLQKQLKGIIYGEDIVELERYKQECQRLEKIVANMKEELRNKRPVSNSGADWEQKKMELEVKLHKANARMEALQDEMTYNAKNYAKEIAQLKLIIAEKQALLDSFTMGGS